MSWPFERGGAKRPRYSSANDSDQFESADEHDSVQYQAASPRERLDEATAKKEQCAHQMDQARKQFEQARKDYASAAVAATTTAENEYESLLEEDNFWNKMYKKLVAYKNEHGHCNVVRTHYAKINQADAENRKLGVWIGKQRQHYRQEPKEIEEFRIIALNKIGFDWDPIDTTWQNHYKELCEWKASNPGQELPGRYKGGALGNWVGKQRLEYQKLEDGKPNGRLTKERLALLRKIDFEWDIYEREFELGFSVLQHYQALFGHCHVPDDFENNFLKDWIKTVRRHYKSKQKAKQQNMMTDERVERLRDLGFCFTKADETWDKHYHSLVAHKQQHGCSYVSNDQDSFLRKWLKEQRKQHGLYKRGEKSSMTPYRIEKLKELEVDGFS